MSAITRQTATATILDALSLAHEAEPFVGGLFHAYEKAVHFLLLTEPLRPLPCDGLRDGCAGPTS